MLIGIAAAGFVGNDSEPFSQGRSEFICFSGHWLVLKLSLGRAEAKLSFSKAAAGSRRASKVGRSEPDWRLKQPFLVSCCRALTDFNIVP